LRFALVFNTAPGTDIALAEDKIKGMKHFGNKLWNIARFVLANIEDSTAKKVSQEQINGITEADLAILDQLTKVTANVQTNLENFRLHEAAQSLYEFVWNNFADVYIEASKSQLQIEGQKENTQVLLLHILIEALKLLHPFMPFVTEVLWQELRKNKLATEELLLTAHWPQ
jgi:valyl-tRNA synthetase